MAENLGTIEVQLAAVTTEFQTGIVAVLGRLSSLENALRATSGQMDETANRAVKSGVIFSKALDLAFKAAGALYGKLREGVTDALAAEKVDRQLAVTLETLGVNARVVGEHIDILASRLQETTGVSDDAIKSAYTYALRLGQTTDQAENLVQTAIALSNVVGGDLDTNMQRLIKTQQGVVDKTLATIPGINDLTEKQLLHGDAIAIINERYGEFAEIGSGDTWKAVQDLTIGFSEMLEELGKAIIKIELVKTGIEALTSSMRGLKDLLSEGVGFAIGASVAAIGDAFGIDTGFADYAKNSSREKMYTEAAAKMAARDESAKGAPIGGGVASKKRKKGEGEGTKNEGFNFNEELTGVAFEEVADTAERFNAAVSAATEEYLKALNAEEVQARVDAEWEAYQAGVEATAEAIEEGAKRTQDMVDDIVDATGETGSMAQAIAAGFKSGGAMGALQAAGGEILKLVDVLGMFSTALQPLNDALLVVGDALESLLAPAFEALSDIFQTVGMLLVGLTPLFDVLAPAIRLLQAALDGVLRVIAAAGLIVMGIAMMFAKIWNGIVDVLLWVFKMIDKIPGVDVGGFRNSLRKARIDTDAMGQSMRDLERVMKHGVKDEAAGAAGQLGDDFNDLGDEMDEFGGAVEDATESLTNVPVGAKVALARFEAGDAINPNDRFQAPGNAIYATIYPRDTEELWKDLQRYAERDNFRSGGTIIMRAAPYVGG